jgi:hypothetical protein
MRLCAAQSAAAQIAFPLLAHQVADDIDSQGQN